LLETQEKQPGKSAINFYPGPSGVRVHHLQNFLRKVFNVARHALACRAAAGIPA
jgi:hypothetical protein